MDTRTPIRVVEVRYRNHPDKNWVSKLPHGAVVAGLLDDLHRNLRRRHYFVTRSEESGKTVFEVT